MIWTLPTLLVLVARACLAAVTLDVAASNGNASSPLLYGIMFEDINHSGDGGIHGQLLQNNGFQGDSPSLNAYSSVGNVTLSVDNGNPLSSAITRTLKVTVPSSASGQVGFSNAGYLGVSVNSGTYANYFWIKGSYSGDVIVSLYGPSGRVYGTTRVRVESTSSDFKYYETTFHASQSYESNNQWKLTFDSSKVKGSSLNFGLVQLFPETYHKRHNGLRNDVASYLQQIKPSFLRFPGGNNLEGSSPEARWKWNETIGPVQNRPGRQGDWGYPNTDALGLMEYLQWCIDMEMEPLLAVWSGLSFNGGKVVQGDALNPYVQDILDELEFLLGDSNTHYGALRAKYGRREPYVINYIEVGNEDNLSGGCASYKSRFMDIYDAIHTAHPHITIIASTAQANCLPEPLPQGVYTDTHHYLTPDQFVKNFNEWDNVPRVDGHGVLVGEYASTTQNNGQQTYWSNMQGSCGEAVYMIGMERNSDLVKMASFAPLLEHFDMAQWSPDLFGLNSTVGSITGSTSFWVQHLFSANRGDTILPVISDSNFGPVYWVASSKSRSSYYVKLANYGSETQSVSVQFRDLKLRGDGHVSTISGDAGTSNFPGDVSIMPKTQMVSRDKKGSYNFQLPAWGVAVLAVSA